ncbi:hypothetical protein [Morganella morganii IS15]|nr:hypothetical protein [Morganella morganii IS15]
MIVPLYIRQGADYSGSCGKMCNGKHCDSDIRQNNRAVIKHSVTKSG